jgi:DNA repair exonuclease SbcCD ATPase subunit
MPAITIHLITTDKTKLCSLTLDLMDLKRQGGRRALNTLCEYITTLIPSGYYMPEEGIQELKNSLERFFSQRSSLSLPVTLEYRTPTIPNQPPVIPPLPDKARAERDQCLQEKKELQEKFDMLEEEHNTNKETVEMVNKKLFEAFNDLKSVKQKKDELDKENKQLKSRQEETIAVLAGLTAEAEDLRKKVKSLRAQLAKKPAPNPPDKKISRPRKRP